MKETKKDIENAILVIADHIDKEMGMKIYTALLKNSVLPEITKILVVNMFIHNVNEYQTKDLELKNSIDQIKKYMIELHTIGFVVFEQS